MSEASMLGWWLEALWRASWQAAVMVPVVLVVQRVFRRQLPPSWRHALWWLVVIRLGLPLTPATSWSLFNTLPASGSRGLLGSERTLPVRAVERVPVAIDWMVPADAAGRLVTDGLSAPVESAGLGESVRMRSDSLTSAGPGVVSSVSSGWYPFMLTVIWLVGVGFFSARVGMAQRRFRRGLGDLRAVADPGLEAALLHASRLMGVRRSVLLKETRAVEGPAVTGILRPVLLLSAGFAARLNDPERMHVFLHELAHLRRGDHWTQWLVIVVQILHWFNPVVWWALARMRTDQEIACDALALAVNPQSSSPAYGTTLLKLAAGLDRQAVVPGALGVVDHPGELRRRIRMIAGFRRRPGRPVIAFALVLMLGIFFLTDAATPEEKAGPVRPEAGSAVLPASSLATEDRFVPPEETAAFAGRAAGEPRPPGSEDWVPPRSPHSGTGGDLETRVYRVNPNIFREELSSLISSVPLDAPLARGPVEAEARVGSLAGVGSDPEAAVLGQRLRNLFRVVGVSFEPPSPNVLLYSHGKGVLMVRAASADLDRIQNVIELLNTTTPQITLEVRVVEIAAQETRQLGFDWFLGSRPQGGVFPSVPSPGDAGDAGRAVHLGTLPSSAGSAGVAAAPVDALPAPGMSLSGILTEPQFELVLRALMNRGTARTLYAPKVTTLSGRQTRITVGEGLLVAEMLAVVLPDGHTLELNIDLEVARPAGGAVANHPGTSDDPPFRSQQLRVKTHLVLWDGQTVVLGGVLSNRAVDAGPAEGNQLLCFITPVIVDPAGNRVHTGVERPPQSRAGPSVASDPAAGATP
jgi:beta-lactamase regulating signal transducer with metallopeptidase domain